MLAAGSADEALVEPDSGFQMPQQSN